MDEEELPPSKFESFAATSNDPSHLPTTMFEAGGGFWVTTGLFPQEVFISFQKSVVVSRIQLVRERMSSLQLQVGRHQSQRDRHRSCSQPRRPTQRHVRRLPLRRVVRRWLPCTRDLRTYCQCRCKPAPLHSLPPTQVRGSCPPHVSSLQLQVGRCQSQRDRSAA